MRPKRQTTKPPQKRHQSTGGGQSNCHEADAYQKGNAAQTRALTAGPAQAESGHRQKSSARVGRGRLAFQTVNASMVLVTTPLAQHHRAQAEAQTFVLKAGADMSTIPTQLQMLQRLWRILERHPFGHLILRQNKQIHTASAHDVPWGQEYLSGRHSSPSPQ